MIASLHPFTYTLWVILAFLFALFTMIAVWSRRPTYLRSWSIIALCLSLPVSAVSVISVLGKPIPLFQGLTTPSGDFKVIGVKMVVDQGIYLLLDTGNYPIFAAIPFDRQKANKIQEMLDNPDTRDTMRMTIKPYEFSWEMRQPPEIYADPQPKVLPDKPHETPQNEGLDTI